MSWGAGATAVTFAATKDREQFKQRWESCLCRTTAALDAFADKPLRDTFFVVANAQRFGLAGPPLRQSLARNLALNASAATPIPKVHFGYALMVGHALFVHDASSENWEILSRALLGTDADEQALVSDYGDVLRAALGGAGGCQSAAFEMPEFARAAVAGALSDRSGSASSALNWATFPTSIARHHHRLFGEKVSLSKTAFIDELLADAVPIDKPR